VAATAHALEDALADDSAFPSLVLLRGLDALSAMVALVAEMVGQSGPPIPAIEILGVTSSSPLALERPSLTVKRNGLASPQVTASLHHLDSLLELVEELRLAHSKLAQSPIEMLERHLAHQRRLVHELHNTILETRLIPVSRAFEGFERLVHDLAQSTGRQAALAVDVGETEMDRSALDPVRELMVHLLRNALIHGIEPPEERQSVDKPPQGTIRLTARQEGDGVVIQVSDDGRGLDRQHIVNRAVALQMCTAKETATMSDADIWAFLTRPNFSTYDGVDHVAGRGIGLNAVKQGIEALRGRVEIESQPGRSTTIRLRLPAMMALEDVVLVGIGEETYALPETIIDGVRADKEVTDLPTCNLRQRLQVPDDGAVSQNVLILCQCSDGPRTLQVDRVLGRETAVIKPLPRCTRRPDFLGAIVTGDGRVVLVLDIERL
jgi:two-component system chemotaxis sensor kinase CheA